MQEEEFLKKCYEAYQLDWMLSQGYSLNDYLKVLAEAEASFEPDEYPEGTAEDIAKDIHQRFEEDFGFGGSLWVCFEEFLGAEFLDKDYMEHLLQLMPASEKMKEQYKKVVAGNGRKE